MFLKQQKQWEADFKLVQEPATTLIRGKEAAWARYESTNKEGKLVRAELYLFVHGKLPYVLKYHTWNETFERYRDSAMKIIESFKFGSEQETKD